MTERDSATLFSIRDKSYRSDRQFPFTPGPPDSQVTVAPLPSELTTILILVGVLGRSSVSGVGVWLGVGVNVGDADGSGVLVGWLVVLLGVAVKSILAWGDE